MSEGVDICVCTFRRTSVAGTLASLAMQASTANVPIRVIVADNDDGPSAEALVREVAEAEGLDLRYVHCPARNISIARNAALDAATAPWVAFLDDDETADPQWIAALLARAAETGAGVVLGPVVPLLGPEAPGWLRGGRFHETRPVFVRGRILTGYTCNVLIRRDAPDIAGERFLESLGRSGGEDTEFFDRLVRNGVQIAYAADAVVREEVPPERQSFGWLLRRRYRFGQSHGAILAAKSASRLGRVRHIGTAFAKAGISAVCAVLTLPSASRRAFWALRAALHAGVVARLCGRAEIEQYGRVAGE